MTELNSASTNILKITMGEIIYFYNIVRPTSNTWGALKVICQTLSGRKQLSRSAQWWILQIPCSKDWNGGCLAYDIRQNWYLTAHNNLYAADYARGLRNFCNGFKLTRWKVKYLYKKAVCWSLLCSGKSTYFDLQVCWSRGDNS